MDSDHSFDIDSSNIKLRKILSLEPGFDKINTTDIPFISWLSFLKSDVSSSLELSLKSSNT